MTTAKALVRTLGRLTVGEREVALHRQIVERILHGIDSGDLAPGEKLPPERELALEWGVSRDTLRQALLSLQSRGRIVRTVGRRGGTFVELPKFGKDVTAYASLSRQLEDQRVVAGARLLSALERTASLGIAAALHIEAGQKVWEIHRLRLADDRPVVLERTYYAAGRLPGLLDQPLEGSLDDLLERRYNVRAQWATEYLEPQLAAPEEALLLGVAVGAPLLYVERISFTSDDVPLEYGEDFYRGDRTRIVAVSHRRNTESF